MASGPATSGPTLIIHLDLNKCVLAVDEVKGYGREEIVYLEEFKSDTAFLHWAFARRADGADLDEETWITQLKESKNEPELISLAREYAAEDAERLAAVQRTLDAVCLDDSVESIWELFRWVQAQAEERVLVVFRTYGTDMPEMFHRCEQHGFGDAVLRVPGSQQPLMCVSPVSKVCMRYSAQTLLETPRCWAPAQLLVPQLLDRLCCTIHVYRKCALRTLS